MAIKILALDGLNDAKLCTLIEQLLETIDGIDAADIDYFSQRLTLQISARNVDAITTQVVETLRMSVPEVSVKLTNVSRETAQSTRSSRAEREQYPLVREQEIYFDEYDDDDEDDEELFEEAEEAESVFFDESQAKPMDLKGLIGQLGDGADRILIGFVLSGLLYLLSGLFTVQWVSLAFSLLAYIIAAFICFTYRPTVMKEAAELPRVFTLAASTLVFVTGHTGEAIGALGFYQITAVLVEKLYSRFNKELAGFTDNPTQTVIRIKDGVQEQHPLADILPGDSVLIGAGETIPFDGTVGEGSTQISRSFLGDGTPFWVEAGDRVNAGDVSLDGEIIVEVLCAGELSVRNTVSSAILKDSAERTNLSHRVRQLTAISVLIALAATVALAILTSGQSITAEWFYHLLVCLLLANPCSLVLAVLTVQRNGLVSALRRNILIRSSKCMETIFRAKTMLMGYRGVVTSGSPTVTEIECLRPEEESDEVTGEDQTEEGLLETAAYAEYGCSHPIADALIDCYRRMTGREVIPSRTGVCEPVAGMGVRSLSQRKVVLAGSRRLMQETGGEVPPNTSGKLCVYLSKYGDYIGRIFLEEPLAEGAQELTSSLRQAGIGKTALLTGSDSEVVFEAGRALGFDAVFAEKSGADKARAIMRLAAKEKALLFAGLEDDVSIIGSLCPTIALGKEALPLLFDKTDAVVPDGTPEMLIEALRISRGVRIRATVMMALFLLGKVGLFTYAFLGGLSFIGAAIFNTTLTLLLALTATIAIRSENRIKSEDLFL